MTEESAPPDPRPARQGDEPPLVTEAEREAAMAMAVDYRGDVTCYTADGRVVEGYVFDRRPDVADPYVRIVPKDGSERVKVRIAEVTRLVFSGRDTASGKSWETWVKKYHEMKARGETARMDPEPLDDDD